MEKSNFEDNIKKVLQDHTEKYDGASWNRLSSFLDQTELDSDDQEEELLFSQLKERLMQQQETLKEAHWVQLKKELDAIDARKERLWSVKLIELTIFLLLLLTYWNLNRIHQYKTVLAPLPDTAVAQHLLLDPTFLDPSAKQGIRSNDQVATISPTQNVSSQRNSENKYVENARAENVMAEKTIVTPISLEKSIELGVFKKGDESELANTDNLLGQLEKLVIRALENSIQFPSIPTSSEEITIISEKYDKRPKGWWVSMTFSRDIDMINSPLDLHSIRTHLLEGHHGNSVGILASHYFRNIEIQSGLRYSEKTFTPGLIRGFSRASQDSYLETQLEEIRFSQVQVPILLRLHAFNETNYNLYAHVGIGVNAILDYKYETEKIVQPSARVAALADYNTLDISTLPSGLTQGGPLSGNLYTTAIVGVGIQGSLPNNTAFFFQPQYQFNVLNGANDFIRRVHSLNIEAGLKFGF